MSVTVNEIEAKELNRRMDRGEVVLVDVREHLEYAEEHLPQAQLFPMSRFDPDALPVPYGKKLVFYCHLGRRSAAAARRWAEATGASECFSLKGGIESWKEAGLKTLFDRAVEHRIERQGYVWSGILVIIGSLSALWVSPLFWIMPFFVGLLLVISGWKGHCYLSVLLSKLPYNK